MQTYYLLTGGSLGRYVQRKLSEIDLWTGNFGKVKEDLRSGVSICERWVGVCETLTTQFWKSYRLHPWKGEKYIPEHLKQLANRLEEVKLNTNRTLLFILAFIIVIVKAQIDCFPLCMHVNRKSCKKKHFFPLKSSRYSPSEQYMNNRFDCCHHLSRKTFTLQRLSILLWA